MWSEHTGGRLLSVWSVITFLFKIPLYVCPRENEQMNVVGRLRLKTSDVPRRNQAVGY